MGDGNQQTNLPPPPEPDPQFQQADVVNDVKRDWKERLFGMLTGGRGGQLDNVLQQHHQARLDEARLSRRNASTAAAQYYYVDQKNINPETHEDLNDPNYKGPSKNELLQRYNNNYLSSMGNYTKIAGVTPETKQAIQKARQIVEHLTGLGQQGQQAQPAQPGQQPAAPAPTPQYPTNVSDTGVSYIPPDQRPGGMTAPPTPNYPTTVSDAGVSFSAPPTLTGGGATAMVPPVAAYTDANGLYHPALKHRSAAEIENASPPAPTAPQGAAAAPSAAPFDTSNFRMEAPFIRGDVKYLQGKRQGLETEQGQFQQGIQQRKEVAENVLHLEPGTREHDYYVATGNMPPVFRLQKTPYIDPTDLQAKFGWGDPASGGPIADELGNPVLGAIPIAAGTQPKQFSWLGPHGEKFPGIQVGTKFYGRTDQGLQELSPSTQIWFAGATPRTTTTVRQVIDQLTGEKQTLTGSRTTAPSFMPQAAPEAAPQVAPTPGGIPPPPTPLGTPPVAPSKTAPKGGGGGSAKAAPSGTFPPGAENEKDARRIAAHQYAQNIKSVTNTTRTMIETAPKVKRLLTSAEDQIDGLKDELGPAAGRWSDFWNHKIGIENPEYMRFRTNTDLAYSLLMRMHRGSQGSDAAQEHFAQIIAASHQSPENMKAAIEEIKAYADQISQEGKDLGIDLKSAQTRAAEASGRRSGVTPPPTSGITGPKTAKDYLSKYGIKPQ